MLLLLLRAVCTASLNCSKLSPALTIDAYRCFLLGSIKPFKLSILKLLVSIIL